MQPVYYQGDYLNPPLAQVHGGSAEDPFGIERPASLGRGLIELLYYLCLFNSAFLYRFGIYQIPYLAGGLVTVSGLLCIAMIAFSNEKFPLTFWVTCVVWMGANLSQVIGNGQMPIIANGLNLMAFFLCQQIMVYYICQNKAGRKRLLVFMAALAIVLIGISGEEVGSGKVKRLIVTETGGLLANANGAAYVCSFLAVALLFWSLRAAKIGRPFLWVMAAALTIITIRTLSRTGLLVLVLGCGLLLLSILSARGARIGGLVLLIVAALGASQLAFTVADSFHLLSERFGGEERNTASRTDLYDLRTLSDLLETTPFGRGADDAIMTSTGITAHNTFVYMHMAFGAVTAWPLIIWQIMLAIRVFRMARASDYPMDTRLMVVAFFGMVLAEYLTNNVTFLEISALYGTAIVEIYTAPYSRRAVARRASEGGGQSGDLSLSPYGGPPAYA